MKYHSKSPPNLNFFDSYPEKQTAPLSCSHLLTPSHQCPFNFPHVTTDIEYVPFERVNYESIAVKKIKYIPTIKKVIEYLPVERKINYSPTTRRIGLPFKSPQNRQNHIYLASGQKELGRCLVSGNEVHEVHDKIKRKLFEKKNENETEKDYENELNHVKTLIEGILEKDEIKVINEINNQEVGVTNTTNEINDLNLGVDKLEIKNQDEYNYNDNFRNSQKEKIDEVPLELENNNGLEPYNLMFQENNEETFVDSKPKLSTLNPLELTEETNQNSIYNQNERLSSLRISRGSNISNFRSSFAPHRISFPLQSQNIYKTAVITPQNFISNRNQIQNEEPFNILPNPNYSTHNIENSELIIGNSQFTVNPLKRLESVEANHNENTLTQSVRLNRQMPQHFHLLNTLQRAESSDARRSLNEKQIENQTEKQRFTIGNNQIKTLNLQKLQTIENNHIENILIQSLQLNPETPQQFVSHNPFQRIQTIENIQTNRLSTSMKQLNNSGHFVGNFQLAKHSPHLQRLMCVETPMGDSIRSLENQYNYDIGIISKIGVTNSPERIKKIEEAPKFYKTSNRTLVPPIRQGGIKNTFQMPILRQTNNEYILEALKQQEINQATMGVNYYISPYLMGYLKK